MTSLHPPAWYGGKHPTNPLCGWIVERLVDTRLYVEPFAGMLGVLLRRRPSALEVVNDLDLNVTTFWRVVREQPQALVDYVGALPQGREDAERMLDVWRDPGGHSDIERAAALLYLGCTTAGATRTSYRTRYRVASPLWTHIDAIAPLADRLVNVQIENRDALEVLDRARIEPAAMIYCDPPYEGAADTRAYAASVDIAALVEMVTAPDTTAKIAVSGYEGSLVGLIDRPGWVIHRRTQAMTAGITQLGSDQKRPMRVECLAVNYERQPTLWTPAIGQPELQ